MPGKAPSTGDKPHRHRRRRRAAVILIFALVSGAAATSPQGGAEPADPVPKGFAVVELFTSQGCSSCPPADELLVGIAQEARERGTRVYTLAFHVDYWNGLGWVDPFSDEAHTKRQKSYARTFATRDIYTPQMTVNGQRSFVGSEATKASRHIRAALAADPGMPIELTVTAGQRRDQVVVQYAAPQATGDMMINIALVGGLRTTDIKRGENAGRQLREGSIVRAFTLKALNKAKRGSTEIILPEDLARAGASIIAYVQHRKTMAVIGAARADLAPVFSAGEKM